MIQTQENDEKPHFRSDLGPLPRIQTAKFFFFKNLALSVTRFQCQLSSCTISEKTNDPILRKLSERRTEGQKEENKFIGRCQSNVERPI